ncbi:MAG: PKD domain-containing protein, partial [Parafilimonas sp.]|nr:PKD domain-containing protein [Parafilimonas sp.]
VGGIVQADFTYVYSNVCKPPSTVTFTNTSQSNTSLNYQWYFGDGAASTQQNPAHTYTTSGNFSVQLTATNSNGCLNSYQQIISVGGVQANFDFIPDCKNGDVVFIDNSTPKPINETWDFGDGNTDTGVQVTHIYNNAGTYQVTLSADFGGCKDTIRKTIKTGQKPQAAFTITGKRATCIYPQTIQFTDESTEATSYKWFFGDGDTSNQKNPAHTYNAAGDYTVELIVYNSNGCSDTLIKTNLIQLGPPQIQGIKNFPYEACAPQTLLLSPEIISGNSIALYQWDFGDGTTSNDSVPTHTYINTGVYNIKLIVVTAEGCSDTLFMPNAVSLGKAPKPKFTADPLNVCAGTSVQFTDKSIGLVTDWLWLFGDGTSSTQQDPSHYYSDTGYQSVTLIVSQYGCYDTLTLKKYIYVNPPVAKFNSFSECDNPFKYTFTDKSIKPQTWHWDFGDGNTSNKQSPSHRYAGEGFYQVTLTVTNGSCTDIRHDSINVIKENPSFNYNSTNFCKYDSIQFFVTGYNPNNIKTFQWDFGDGILTQPGVKNDSVYHLYTDAGTYSPILVVKDINNCIDTINKKVDIQIFGPNAAFSNKAGACLLSTINFNDESTTDGQHNITTWIWNYGDSTKTDTLNSGPFAHTYLKTGMFDVSLKVFDNNGCYDTVSNIDAINITKPVAGFSANDTLTCSGSMVNFLDSSQGISLLYAWNFGDGQVSGNPEPLHKYAAEGVYDIKLIVHDKYGCVDSLTKPQYIRVANPVAEFALPDTLFSCPPAKIDPVNNSVNYNSVTWDFGDGNTSSQIMPEHYYTAPGNYTLSLVVQGYGTCYDTIIKPLVVKGPVALLSYSPLSGCNPLNVSFAAKAKNTVGYIWDFGNGETVTSTDSNAAYNYTKPGRFLPQLIVVDSGGCHTPVVNKDTIVIYGVDTKFSAVLQSGTCDSTLYNFIDSSVALYDNISSYYWNFGDGSISYDANPSHYYHNSATYNASLNITTANGCIDTFALPINVLIDSTPLISALIPDSACVNATVIFTANLNNNSAGSVTWKWDLGNGLLAYNNDTTYNFSTAGTYNISVTATSAAGCMNTLSHPLRIDPLPAVYAGIDSAICLGQNITLNATGANIYTWRANETLSCYSCTNPVADPSFNTTYYLTGTNNYGCINNDSVNIKVVQPAKISINAPDTVCRGNVIQLNASGEEVYQWEPSSLVTNSTDSTTSSTPQTTTIYSVIGRDMKGCFSDTATATVTVFSYPTLQLKDSNVIIESGSEYHISPQGSEDITSWQWSPPSGISCLNCPDPVLKPVSNQTYTVVAKNIAGCSVEKHISITVLCKGQNLFIPNTFSPNGDGMNDYFYPRGKGFSVKSFRIFSRWGTIVYERTNFPPNQQNYGWDGTYNGKTVTPDVYVFIAEILCDNGGIITTKGNITLLR